MVAMRAVNQNSNGNTDIEPIVYMEILISAALNLCS